ncbi:antitermination protein [Kosakonia cowanii]|nr:antitermination protein [Kosakonia cowanii]
MRDIQMVLERWGAWAASGDANIGYPRTAAGLARLLPASRQGRVSCCDDDGLIISSAMRVLKNKDAYLCTLLEWYYVNGMTLRGIGNRLGISHNQVSVRLQKAEGFIEGCLAALGVTLEMDRYVQRESVSVEISGGSNVLD